LPDGDLVAQHLERNVEKERTWPNNPLAKVFVSPARTLRVVAYAALVQALLHCIAAALVPQEDCRDYEDWHSMAQYTQKNYGVGLSITSCWLTNVTSANTASWKPIATFGTTDKAGHGNDAPEYYKGTTEHGYEGKCLDEPCTNQMILWAAHLIIAAVALVCGAIFLLLSRFTNDEDSIQACDNHLDIEHNRIGECNQHYGPEVTTMVMDRMNSLATAFVGLKHVAVLIAYACFLNEAKKEFSPNLMWFIVAASWVLCFDQLWSAVRYFRALKEQEVIMFEQHIVAAIRFYSLPVFVLLPTCITFFVAYMHPEPWTSSTAESDAILQLVTYFMDILGIMIPSAFLAITVMVLERNNGPLHTPGHFQCVVYTVCLLLTCVPPLAICVKEYSELASYVSLGCFGLVVLRIYSYTCITYYCPDGCLATNVLFNRDVTYCFSTKERNDLGRNGGRSYDAARAQFHFFGLVLFLTVIQFLAVVILLSFIDYDQGGDAGSYRPLREYPLNGAAVFAFAHLILQCLVVTVLTDTTLPARFADKVSKQSSESCNPLATLCALMHNMRVVDMDLPDLNWDQIMIAIRCAQDIYYDRVETYTPTGPYNQILQEPCYATTWDRPGFTCIAIIEEEVTDTHCYLYRGPNNELIVCFRGTVSKANLDTDLKSGKLIPFNTLPDLVKAFEEKDGKTVLQPESNMQQTWLTSLGNRTAIGADVIIGSAVDDIGGFVQKGTCKGQHDVVDKKVKCGLGYMEAYASVVTALHHAVEWELQRDPPPTLLVTGHSLGGALALVSAMDLRLTFPDVKMDFISFGQPFVGNGHHTKFMESLDISTLRVCHDKDMIPGLGIFCGLSCFGYSHLKHVLQLQFDDFLRNPRPAEYFMLMRRKNSWPHHSPAKYGRVLESVIYKLNQQHEKQSTREAAITNKMVTEVINPYLKEHTADRRTEDGEVSSVRPGSSKSESEGHMIPVPFEPDHPGEYNDRIKGPYEQWVEDAGDLSDKYLASSRRAMYLQRLKYRAAGKEYEDNKDLGDHFLEDMDKWGDGVLESLEQSSVALNELSWSNNAQPGSGGANPQRCCC